MLNPETIKVIDPACGSGHILVEAYDVLKAIYLERGYRLRDIPKLILENNLFGLDIDDRAAQLAGFALMMKAREDDRRIFTRDIKLNVLALQSTQGLNVSELWRKLALNKDVKSGTTESIFDDVGWVSDSVTQQIGATDVGLRDKAANPTYILLETLLEKFSHAKTFGSLIQIPAEHANFLKDLLSQLQELSDRGDSFQKPAAMVLLPFVQQASLLAQRYDAVIANPPYMGGKGMNPELKAFAQKQFPDSKSDLFAMFMERAFDLLKDSGYNAQVNMQSWMFLSSYQSMREKLLDTHTFITMAHLGARAFGQISGEVVQTTAFVLAKKHIPHYQPMFFRLIEGNEEVKRLALLNKENTYKKIQQDDFKKIPSSPIAYWASNNSIESFYTLPSLSSKATPKQGLATGDNNKFLRNWYEVTFSGIRFDIKNYSESISTSIKWVPYSKGGGEKKWFGFNEQIVYWKDGGDEIRNFTDDLGNERSRFRGYDFYFYEAATWGLIASGNFSCRYRDSGFVYDIGGMSLFSGEYELNYFIGFLNSVTASELLRIINPTLNFQAGDIGRLPIAIREENEDNVIKLVQKCISSSRKDWNTYETSWDFQSNPLIVGWVSDSVTQQTEVTHVGLRDKAANPTYKLSTIYANWQAKNHQTIAEMQHLEQENNRLFIDAYGLQDELKPDVPLEQITLTVNPKYRYGGNLSDEELAQRFQSDTLAELISYAIGCMMGRYRLDKPGLIYAHAGNVDFDAIYNGVGADLSATGRINSPLQFAPDDDGIIPLTDQEWFKDDATNRFRDFVRTVWGEAYLTLNLDFIAESLCFNALKPKKSESSLETVRRYLSTQFYKDHLKTYKKRPIYWLFSSGKQKGFECLVYLHRYNESTLSRMRTEYVTPLLGKYDAFAVQLNKQMEDSSTSEATRIKKDLIALEKKQTELRAFDDKLKHYADMRIKIDLDDGIKVNYGKFGDLLVDVKAVTGEK